MPAGELKRRLPRAVRVASLPLLAVALVCCTSLLDLDGYQSSSDALCGVLDICYGQQNRGCRGHVDTGLSEADRKDRSRWLDDVGALECTGGCKAARLCLDLTPVCGTESCERAEDCCGFLAGRRGCDADRGACCLRRGQPCTGSGACCPGSPCENGLCGGVACREVGEPCSNSFDCCTDVCAGGVCGEACSPNQFECAEDAECCSRFCDPQTLRCDRFPECAPEGAPCVPEGREGEGCCDGLHCVEQPPGSPVPAVCSQEACRPRDAVCEEDDDCCEELVCDERHGLCGNPCGSTGADCEAGGDCCSGSCTGGSCACSEEHCTADGDCCSGRCDVASGTCALACEEPDCDHGLLGIGGPLGESCTDIDAACLAELCETGLEDGAGMPIEPDPYCCCYHYDELCVGLAQTLSQQPASACRAAQPGPTEI